MPRAASHASKASGLIACPLGLATPLTIPKFTEVGKRSIGNVSPQNAK